ncbi:hypothetical protein [Spiroplasma ixodetis]|uniref:Uncharacterized protein n=1 Tax=Spiroplasma ixodetis TaxID=2141 RepID=A0ABM8JLE2_9MOLU
MANISNIDIKIKVTEKNKAFAKFDWITISNLSIIADRNDLSIFPAEINFKWENTDQIIENFKGQLVYELSETKPSLIRLKLKDVEITKIDGYQIISNDINAVILDIKITAKSNSRLFKGEKNIKVNIMIFYTFKGYMNAYSLAMRNNKSDWYISTEVPNSYNSKVYKNGQEIAHLDSQVFSLVAVGNDWYVGTQTDLVKGKIYQNGQ